MPEFNRSDLEKIRSLLPYQNPVLTPQGVLSCDSVRVSFEIRPEFLEALRTRFYYRAGVDYYQKSGLNKYRSLYVISYPDADTTCSLAYDLNDGTSNKRYVGMLDYNPNKLLGCKAFAEDLRFIRSVCGIWEVKRVDVALDIPVSRKLVALKKDQRVYEARIKSLDDTTEYLGLKSHLGRVKVYNKALELKAKDKSVVVDLPITRIEVTCEPTYSSYKSLFPAVYALGDTLPVYDLSAISSLSDDDFALLRLLVNSSLQGQDFGFVLFNSLSSKKQKKLKQFYLPEASLVALPSFDDFELVASSFSR